MPAKAAKKAAARPHQIKGADVQKKTVEDTIERVVSEIRREHDAGILPRSRITFRYVVKTRAKICTSTVHQPYHKTSYDRVISLVDEVNGEAPAAIKPKRKQKPRQPTYFERLADMAREVEAARYLKRTEVAAANERADAFRTASEQAKEEANGLRMERDRLRRELEGLRSMSAGRRPASTAAPRNNARQALR